MKQMIRAGERFRAQEGWLDSYWLFSFGHYHDDGNMGHGVLRVFNDDVIDGKSGFPMHPHRYMEIVTLVHEGQIEHKDSVGNHAIVKAGEIQRMYAGGGVLHSEVNPGDAPLKLFQLWFYPKAIEAPISYAQAPMGIEQDVLSHVAGEHHDFKLNAAADIYMGRGSFGVEHACKRKHALIYVRSGEVRVGGDVISAGDQLRLTGETSFSIQSTNAEWILIETDDQD